MRVAIIISPDIQDKYFAGQIIEHFDVAGVFVEPQREPQPFSRGLSRLSNHFFDGILNPRTLAKRFSDQIYYRNYRKRVEALFRQHFHEKASIIDTHEGCPVVHTGAKEVSSARNVDLLRALAPDVVTTCGCSLLKENLLTVPPLGTINLHGGLAPHYRGCSCHFWPLYNNEPQYLGVTIHYVSPGIDQGEIIHQQRPVIEPEDDENTLFVKIMKIGTQLMMRTLQEIRTGTARGYQQTEKGRLYLDSATTIGHFRQLHEKLKAGLIREYLAQNLTKEDLPEIVE